MTDTITLDINMTAVIGGAIAGLVTTSWNFLPLLLSPNLAGAVMQFRPLLIFSGLTAGLGTLLLSTEYRGNRLSLPRKTVATVVAAFLVFGGLGYATTPVALSLSSNSGPTQLSGDNLRVATLHVDGMVCQGCRLTVKNYLQSMEGTRKVSVDLSKQEATVIYDADTVSTNEIVNSDIFQGVYSATVQQDRRYTG
ncbi:MAG: heavy-metal-associated domain-containing protein [Candidatus Nanohaloarchaea archaeon]|nr:heavy-metal-associated domain-containing protein [Candidatus Nanohaloarchaea archaeon]